MVFNPVSSLLSVCLSISISHKHYEAISWAMTPKNMTRRIAADLSALLWDAFALCSDLFLAHVDHGREFGSCPRDGHTLHLNTHVSSMSFLINACLVCV